MNSSRQGFFNDRAISNIRKHFLTDKRFIPLEIPPTECKLKAKTDSDHQAETHHFSRQTHEL